jgi:hypothetical protein
VCVCIRRVALPSASRGSPVSDLEKHAHKELKVLREGARVLRVARLLVSHFLQRNLSKRPQALQASARAGEREEGGHRAGMVTAQSEQRPSEFWLLWWRREPQMMHAHAHARTHPAAVGGDACGQLQPDKQRLEESGQKGVVKGHVGQHVDDAAEQPGD